MTKKGIENWDKSTLRISTIIAANGGYASEDSLNILDKIVKDKNTMDLISESLSLDKNTSEVANKLREEYGLSDCPTKITQEKALSLDTKIFIYSSTNHICEYIPPNNDDRFYTITLRDKLKEDNCQFLPKLKIDVEAKKFLYKDRNLNLKSYSEEEVLEFGAEIEKIGSLGDFDRRNSSYFISSFEKTIGEIVELVKQYVYSTAKFGQKGTYEQIKLDLHSKGVTYDRNLFNLYIKFLAAHRIPHIDTDKRHYTEIIKMYENY